jgi:hypothetical protein
VFLSDAVGVFRPSPSAASLLNPPVFFFLALSHIHSFLTFRDAVVRGMVHRFFAFSTLVIPDSPYHPAHSCLPFRRCLLGATGRAPSVDPVPPDPFSDTDFTSGHLFHSYRCLFVIPIALACAAVFAHFQSNHTLCSTRPLPGWARRPNK